MVNVPANPLLLPRPARAAAMLPQRLWHFVMAKPRVFFGIFEFSVMLWHTFPFFATVRLRPKKCGGGWGEAEEEEE